MSCILSKTCAKLKQSLLLSLLAYYYTNLIEGTSGERFGWKEQEFARQHPSNDHNRFHISSDDPIVSIRDGLLRGSITETIGKRKVVSFRGIPYGRPPLGTLRFQAPLKVEPWQGIRNANQQESPQCIQIDFMTQARAIRGQEDCLFLDLHVPLEPFSLQRLPVLVFFHGGSFASGSGTLYGPYYLLDQDVILVSINYRLGPFGFLSTGSSAAYGNAGLKDQVLSLKWIQDNIDQFGGDPNSVTIFGQSAGAAAVQHHIVSPSSQGLFHRGISQSGSSNCWFAISENAHELATKTGSLFDCYGDSNSLVQCLQKVPAEQLVTAHLNLTDWNSFPIVVFAPVIEVPNPSAFLTEHPAETYRKGKASKVPWITGFARYEMGWLFSDFIQNISAVAQLNREWNRLGPIFLTIAASASENSRSRTATKIRDFYLGRGNTEIGFRNRYEISQMLGDRFFLKCGLDGMRLHAQYTGQPVYAYEFSFEGKYSIVQLYGQNAEEWGVAHLDDVIYLLNNTEHFSRIRMDSDKEEYKMVQIMTSTWANFATYGIPYIGGTDQSDRHNFLTTGIWKPIELRVGTDSVASFQFLDLCLTPRMIPNPYLERYRFWNSLQLID